MLADAVSTVKCAVQGVVSNGRVMAAILLAVVVVVVVAVIMVARARVRRHSEFLNGYWVATSQFAADAKLSEFQLFIAPSNASSNAARQGYIIIVDADGAPVANQAIELRIKPRRGIRNLAADEYRGQITISPADKSENEEMPFPATLEFAVSVFNGALTLFDKEAVFASLTKDYATTEAALNAYAK